MAAIVVAVVAILSGGNSTMVYFYISRYREGDRVGM